MLRIRWWLWVLALAPATAGVVSIALGMGDFRSSGLILGVSLSLGLLAILLLWRRPWRDKNGVSNWLAPLPGLLLGFVALLGVSGGLPEFLQARGLFIDVGSVGPIAVVDHEGTLVIVGNDAAGGFVWTSGDGSHWTRVENESITELEVADAAIYNSGLVVVGESAEAEGVVMVSEDGEAFEISGRFGNGEHGTIPQAAAGFTERLVVISEIYGNDVEFFTSVDAHSWVAGQPSPLFDDGESARDIACSDQVCLGVGFLDSTYRQDLDANTGVVWVSASGDNYQAVNHNFGAERLDAVAWNDVGFVVVGTNADGSGSVWHSTDGTKWKSVSGPFTEMTVDGVEASESHYLVFGRKPTTGAVVVWTSDNTTDWTEAVVATGLTEASQVRSIATTQNGLIAAGIDGGTSDVLVWTSKDGNEWQQSATLPPR